MPIKFILIRILIVNYKRTITPSSLHPLKSKKGQLLEDAADNLFSKAVSGIRQPIESFFNWLNEKTQIQNASKVRSSKGLMAHVWGKIAAAFCLLSKVIFNP